MIVQPREFSRSPNLSRLIGQPTRGFNAAKMPKKPKLRLIMIDIPGKIPIRIQPLFWILIGLIGWLNTQTFFGTAQWAVVMTVSILFHEFGHALTAVLFGQKAEIELVGFGGVTKRHGPPLKHWKEFVIVLNGPLAGLFLGFLSFEAYAALTFPGPNSAIGDTLLIAIYVNVVWTLVNLIPVLPLDGAHLVRILLESLFGLKGVRLAALLSLVVGVLVCVLSFVYHYVIAGAFFMMMAYESYKAWSLLGGMTDEDMEGGVQERLHQGEEAFKKGHYDEALPLFLSLRNEVTKGVVFLLATQYAAHIYADQSHYQEAYDFLKPIEKTLQENYQFLLLQMTFHLKKWHEAIRLGEKLFKETPTSEIALINALSYAALGRAKPSIGWLHGACRAGLADVPKVLNRKEFDPIRLTPEFQQFQL
jgi:stage IV sporulation protein FB